MKAPDHRYLPPDVTRPAPVPPAALPPAPDDTLARLAESVKYGERVAKERAAREAAGLPPLSFRDIVAGLRPGEGGA